MDDLNFNNSDKNKMRITIDDKIYEIQPGFSVYDYALMHNLKEDRFTDYQLIIAKMIAFRIDNSITAERIIETNINKIDQYIDLSVATDDHLLCIFKSLTIKNKSEKYVVALKIYSKELSDRLTKKLSSLTSITNIISNNAIQTYKQILEETNWIKSFVQSIQETFNKVLPTLTKLAEESLSLSKIIRIVKELSNEQFVLIYPLPRQLIEADEDINSLIDTHLATDLLFDQTVKDSNLHSLLFEQSIEAVNSKQYNLAILGLTAVLDNILSEYSGQIKNVHITSRCKAIISKIEQKGELFLDDIEGRDYLLLTSYPIVLESFGADSDFLQDEPNQLNRHWIMHGRTKRQYSKTDCHKILNMIYGTIRLGIISRDESNN